MVAGIVCEYNPFHKGHLYQLEETKRSGADYIVCVMSGNFVQRGECALLDKWKRAEIAVRSGADVVIDLPVPWAVSSAESFARGSIFLLKQAGVDAVFFGSESEDREKLLLVAESTQGTAVQSLVKERMSEGQSYPFALYNAVNELYGQDAADIIASPNSTLAVEYIRQIKKQGGMDFIPIKRKGSIHDSDETDGEFISASAIRGLICGSAFKHCISYLNKESAFVLEKALDEGTAPCSMDKNERAVLSGLRGLDKTELEKYISDYTGLSSRIYDGIRAAKSLDELYEKAKSRNYTYSRVRREVLSAFLGIPKEISLSAPPYMRVLAVSGKGLDLLSDIKKNSAVPVVTKHAEMQNLDEFSKMIYELQCSSTDRFALFSPEVRPCGLEQKNPMLIIK